MDGQVPFKVFVFWSEDAKPEVRRFTIDATVVSNFNYLNNKLQCVCPGLKGKTYAVTWEDEDLDSITISSDEELMVALTTLAGNPVKLNIQVKSADLKDDDCDIVITADIPTGIGACPAKHVNVVCDGCEGAIIGFRYKCTTCDDFDLCSKCEAAGKHPQHCMLRVPSPQMPRDVIKVAVKRSRHLLNTIASAVEEGGHKRNRRDRSGEGRHHGDRYHFRGEGHGDRHHRRPRFGWLDTFATYMNEFANLAGDIGLDNEEKPAETASQQSKPDQAPAGYDNTQASHSQSQHPDMPKCPFASGLQNIPKLVEMHLNGQKQPEQDQAPAGSNNTQASHSQPQSQQPEMPKCPFASELQNIPKLVEMHLNEQRQPEQDPKNNVGGQNPTNTTVSPPKQAEAGSGDSGEYTVVLPVMETIPKLIELYLKGNLNPYIQQFTQQFQTDQETKASSVASTTGNDVEMSPSDPKPQEADNSSTASQCLPSTSAGTVRDASPDKIEGWTMINKEKDFADTSDTASASTPIGFNLPMEFQQRVSISSGENIYPALNVATAVLNPKEPERGLQEPLKPKRAPMPAQPKPSAPQEDKATPQPAQPQNPKPHIDAALKQMLAMGFTNEEGWLTQMLESTNGNISAVMDLLTPIRPK